MKQRLLGNSGMSASVVALGSQLQDNARAGELNLEPADIARIRADVERLAPFPA